MGPALDRNSDIQQTSAPAFIGLETDEAGVVRIVPHAWPLIANSGPLRTSSVKSACSIRFHWLAADGLLLPSCLPEHFLVAVTHGALELSGDALANQLLRVGSLLQSCRSAASKVRIRSADGGACRFAVLDTGTPSDGEPATVSDASGSSIAFLHNRETDDGISYFEHRQLELPWRAGDCLMSNEISVVGVQIVKAAADLDYDWHPAPQRQIVLVLTGGLAMEYGNGSRASLLPGEFLLGEDMKGKGHKTRSLLGAERLSIFVHLDDVGIGEGIVSRSPLEHHNTASQRQGEPDGQT